MASRALLGGLLGGLDEVLKLLLHAIPPVRGLGHGRLVQVGTLLRLGIAGFFAGRVRGLGKVLHGLLEGLNGGKRAFLDFQPLYGRFHQVEVETQPLFNGFQVFNPLVDDLRVQAGHGSLGHLKTAA